MSLRPAVLILPLGDSVESIDRALRALQAYDSAWIQDRGAPPLYDSGVRYRREPTSARFENWWTIPDVLRAGYGDCEDLACWRAAECGGRAFAVEVPTGYHILVRRPDGRIEDPSRRLGMGRGR